MKRATVLLALLLALPVSAQMTANNASCDISVTPAATLLLPYFEVDISSPTEHPQTTIFTVVNTTQYPQVARLTLWTDWSYPVLTQDLFLTGYDALSINLRDVIVDGRWPDVATVSTPAGRISLPNASNPLQGNLDGCRRALPSLPPSLLRDVQHSLTNGSYSECGTSRVGGVHTNAIGFATIDLVANCAGTSPLDAGSFDDLLYDNVLTGDYQHVTSGAATGNHAGGAPLVHIRAIPAGGAAGELRKQVLPYTFYDRFAPAGREGFDRRQPLPSTFAARYIQGGGSGFLSNFMIWRERTLGPTAECSSYVESSRVLLAESVRFDERENATTLFGGVFNGPGPFLFVLPLPSVTRISSASTTFPLMTSGDVAGWMYLNLHDTQPGRPLQSWVTIHRFAEGRHSVLEDAAFLGNGCTPATAAPTNRTNNPIRPK